MKLYSVIINWHDRDPDQGTYGATVRAHNHGEAETMVRQMMRASLAEERGCEVEEVDDEFGSPVEVAEGAIWKAAELEQALRSVLRGVSPYTRHEDILATEARARALLAEIDSIGVDQ